MSKSPNVQVFEQKKQDKKKELEIDLNGQQRRVLQWVLDKKSVFFTGKAGTGKSLLLKTIVKELGSRMNSSEFCVTAPTGMAACLIGGSTLHSFIGCGLANEPSDVLARKISQNVQAMFRWRNCKVLVIDEISLVDAAFFDKLEHIARIVRSSTLPFGGIQLVMCGDFLQLPPVKPRYCFESEAWKKLKLKHYVLEQVYRQDDLEFINILDEIRYGRISTQSQQRLLSLKPDTSVPYTQLVPTRQQVDQINKEMMDQLPSSLFVYESQDTGRNPSDVKRLEDTTLAPKTLQLKEGCQVMLIKNIHRGMFVIPNGTMGHVTQLTPSNVSVQFYVQGTTKSDGLPITLQREMWSLISNGKDVARRLQYPVVPSYALTIHKAQGQTLQRVKIDLGKIFQSGQAYVALSRSVSLNHLWITNYKRECFRADPRAVAFHEGMSNK